MVAMKAVNTIPISSLFFNLNLDNIREVLL